MRCALLWPARLCGNGAQVKPMTQPLRIDQFAPTVAVGDGVTNSLLFIRSLLRALGYLSDIHSFSVPASLRGEIGDARLFDANSVDLLMYHHSMGHEHGDWLVGLECLRALVYHNITPAEFFPEDSALHRYSILGRQQLIDWRQHFQAAIAVSTLNAHELQAAGYTDITQIPLLVDSERLRGPQNTPAFMHSLPASCELYLSVGRLAENKRQYLLIEAFHHLLKLRRETASDARLLLVGGTTSEEYACGLRRHVYQIGLIGKVLMPGKCSDAELRWLYAHARQYWCASAHEGFCMPLVEAGQAGLPVVAFARSNIPDTLGESGLLLDSDDPLEFALASHHLECQTSLRERCVEAGQRNLHRYERVHLQQQLALWSQRLLSNLSKSESSSCSASC